jgi:RNA polymerase sigma-54 factor
MDRAAPEMALGIRLDLKQSQQLAMTPQLQQAIKLLQMSNLELREFVEHELETNPLIRLEGNSDTRPDSRAEPFPAPEAHSEIAEAPLDTRVTSDGDHSLGAETFDTGRENLYDIAPGDTNIAETPQIGGGIGTSVGAGGNLAFDASSFDLEQQPDRPVSLQAHLLAQLGQCRADPPILMLARLLVEELDEHGFLRGGMADLAERLGAEPRQVEAALALLQGCEPTGVGARDLAECLALQLAERDRLDPAMRLLLANLRLLERGDLRRLKALCGVDDEDFPEMLSEIRALDPRPCAAFHAERAETLIPDVYLRRVPGDHLGGSGWQIELNTETLPKVLIDNRYATRLAAGGREASSFVTQCSANANWLIRSLDQRARTILSVTAEIVRKQDRFFVEGIPGLTPLTLAMVADAVGLHESTVSRVTSNKYIATERGIFELKFFFTNAVGAEGLSAETVRHRISNLVAAEVAGAVLSDEEIVKRLQSDGVEIARRTVVKYRKALGIPSSVDRRRRFAMLSKV